MPAGHTPTLLNRHPICVGDDTQLNSVLFGTAGPGTTSPSRRNDIPLVISGQVTARTLLASESGALCLFDAAAGIIYTLPAPVIGLYYDFWTTVTITSNNATVITDAGTTFVMGAASLVVDNSATGKGFQGNGSSHIKIQSNGTTTGGVLGSWFRAVCVSATKWSINGTLMASGTIATPFA